MPAAPLDVSILQASVDAWARHDRSQTKAAIELGISPGTLKSRLLNARARGITPGKQRIRVKAETRTASMASPPTTPSAGTRREPPTPDKRMVNQRVLIISDLHCPHHNESAIQFLSALKEKYNPDRVINVGDELDLHKLSYHEHDPDMDGPRVELENGRKALWKLERLFPEMDILESNHTSLVFRKAKTSGLPKHLIRSYRDIIFGEVSEDGTLTRPGDRGAGWTWQWELVIDTPCGPVAFRHDWGPNILQRAQQNGMSLVQGHRHGLLEARYASLPMRMVFGMSVGCLIDLSHPAFAYGKSHAQRPVIGCGIILDGEPRTLRMPLNDRGWWNGRVP